MIKRRTLLKAGGVVGVPAVIGAGVRLHPFRPQLYDIRMDNRRDVPVSVNVQMEADGSQVMESTIEVPPDEILHLPCDWPRSAWSYEMAVRLRDEKEWATITWDSAQKLCKKIVITDVGNPAGPISFYEAGRCPTSLGDHSCG